MGRKSRPAGAPLATAATPGPGRLWPVGVVLITGVWIAFAPALDNGFVDWDDHKWILQDHAFRGLGWDQVRYAFTTFAGSDYHPLGWLLQSLTYACCGLEPRGYHRVSLLFHAANVVLLHRLCVELVARGMPETAARVGGALGWLCGVPVVLYAVHPLRVETVAWASCQAHLPSICFAILATLAYLRAHPAGGGFHRRWMIGSSLLMALAVLAKGSAIVLPAVFLILDVYPLGRFGPARPSWPAVRQVLLEKVPILVLGLAFTAVAFAAKSQGEPEVTAQPVIVARLAQASYGAWFYLAKTVWPFGLTAFYPRPEDGDFQTPLFAACVAGMVLAVAAALWQRRRWPGLLAAGAAYLVIAAPFLGLAQVNITLASDHYGHAPLMAWVVLGCAGICRLAQRRWSRPVWLGAAAGALLVIGGLMALSSAQCRVWDSTEHLWRHALEHAPWSSELHDFLGTTLADEGKLEPAIAEFREALRIRPDSFEALSDLGVALDRHGETAAGITRLREAARLRPRHARVHLNLGAALVRQGHFEEAIALYRDAIALQPGFPNLHFNLGVALLRQRRVDEAVRELKRAVALRPWYAEAYAALGTAAVLRGRQDEAADQYRKALGLDPDDSNSRMNLGLALARQGRSAEAVAQLRETIRRDRRNPEAHHVLGAILTSLGQREEAAAELEEVLRLRPDHRQARALLTMARESRR